MLRTRYNTQLNSQVAHTRQQIRSAVEEIRQLLHGPLQQLPIEKLYQAPDEGEWTLMETLAHIIEFMPYWADEINKLIQNPDQHFGRCGQERARLHTMKKHNKDTLVQVRINLFISYTHLDRVLRPLQDTDLQLEGFHETFGECTVAWLIDECILRHLHEHIAQIQIDLLVLNQLK